MCGNGPRRDRSKSPRKHLSAERAVAQMRQSAPGQHLALEPQVSPGQQAVSRLGDRARPLRRQYANVLCEEDYTAALSLIIERDFFPDNRILQIDKDHCTDKAASSGLKESKDEVDLEPIEEGSAAHIAQLLDWTSASERLRARNSLVFQDAKRMGLDEFNRKYTSEDNDSFLRIIDRERTRRREAAAWAYSENNRSESEISRTRQAMELEDARIKSWQQDRGDRAGGDNLLKLTEKEARSSYADARDQRSAAALTWPRQSHTQQDLNALIFGPDSGNVNVGAIDNAAPGSSDDIARRNETAKQIQHRNAAIPPEPMAELPEEHDEGAAGESENADDEEQDLKINGYSLIPNDDNDAESWEVMTLRKRRAELMKVRERAQEISTAFYKIQERNHRDEVHDRLARRIAQRQRQGSSQDGSQDSAWTRVTPRFSQTPIQQRGMMSPAGQRLLRTSLRRRTPSTLRSPSSAAANVFATPLRGDKPFSWTSRHQDKGATKRRQKKGTVTDT